VNRSRYFIYQRGIHVCTQRNWYYQNADWAIIFWKKIVTEVFSTLDVWV
jgi:hypothetical protein